MSNPKAPSPIRAADYEAIEAALLESARGRWFLAEYFKRNRGADTRMLLDAISKLETTILRPHEGAKTAHIRRDLIEMAEAISRTRSEIAAMRSADQEDWRFTIATEGLDAIVEATAKATSDILEAAEDVQEIAWLLRERGAEDAFCDRLDARATDVYTACSFQDLTGQRTSKVVQTLRFLENRVLAMIDIWGLEDIEVRDGPVEEQRPDAHLLNGPARSGERVDQDKVDKMIEAGRAEGGPVIDRELTGPAEAVAAHPDKAMSPKAPGPEASSEQTVAVTAEPQITGPAGADASPAEADAVAGEVESSAFQAPPSAEVDVLSETQKQALFS